MNSRKPGPEEGRFHGFLCPASNIPGLEIVFKVLSDVIG